MRPDHLYNSEVESDLGAGFIADFWPLGRVISLGAFYLRREKEFDTEILAIAPLLDRASDGSDEVIDWELVVPVVERYALKKAELAFS